MACPNFTKKKRSLFMCFKFQACRVWGNDINLGGYCERIASHCQDLVWYLLLMLNILFFWQTLISVKFFFFCNYEEL